MKVSQKGSLLSQHNILKNIIFLGVVVMVFGGKIALAQNTLPSVKNDYIPCDVQPCVTIAGSEWSEKNQNGVAVAVRMGVKPAVTDAEIKMVLTHDLKKHGVKNIKFFYEQNDGLANLIFFHIRGGLEGPFTIDTVRQQIPTIARRALNDNPVFRVD